MGKHCILVSGPTIASDRILIRDLEKFSEVVRNADNTQIELLLVIKKIDLILIELSKDKPSQVEIIKKVKGQFPDIEIILIDGNGDTDTMARAFAYGSTDAFRKPYKMELIVERVGAILHREVHNWF